MASIPLGSDPSAGLNEAQISAVTDESKRLCIIAGAGAGKTTVMANRISHRVNNSMVPSPRILAISFTRSAAEQLRSRVRLQLDGETVECVTFHSFALSLTKKRADDTQTRPPKLIESKIGLLRTAVSEVAKLEKIPNLATSYKTLREIATEIEWARAKDLNPESYGTSEEATSRFIEGTPSKSRGGPQLNPAIIAKIFRQYQREKHKVKVIDLDDLITNTSVLLEDDPQFRSTFNWLYREIYVDEYQDINPAQLRLLRAMVSPETGLCVVGDPRQAIFGWNGSDPNLILDFDLHFGPATTLELSINYRSTPEILRIASAIELGRASKLAPLTPSRISGSQPQISCYRDDTEEAASVSARILDLIETGVRPSSIAVLSRVNALLTPISDQLGKLGVPHSSPNGTDATDVEEITAATVLLRNLDANLSISEVCDELEAGLSLGDDPSGALLALPTGFTRSRWLRGLESLLKSANSLRRSEPDADLATLELQLFDPDNHISQNSAVTLASFHRAKGQEWSHVFIIGLEEGMSPYYLSVTPAQLEEEARLFYVAITRAKNVLEISYCQARRLGSGQAQRTRSRFLDQIDHFDKDLLAISTEPTKLRSPQVTIDLVRQTLSGLTKEQHTIKTGLEQWRRRRSIGLGIAERSLLSNSAINQLIASPSSNTALLEGLLGDEHWVTEAMLQEITEVLRRV